ncbi:major facilitator superfamily domain-containing protein [Emericellopsis atlantica]|uniref:Major facilitator superfamily domain-containing protein n=1 Tax=Emericellopsis atlantica TaxID=2614577 RepID=A0A9P7ZEG5_9HYPO|nr:major facilitator superfamily domain-containing protein [Emericellopsis atlantica]KAG9249963.1 major facilitator superfamily domain-containing protein [Emericellopsis atlantica]
MRMWSWRGIISVFLLTSLISGYDVSNVANIQPRLYEEFGRIELLPWIGLSYSLANLAVLPYSRRMISCFDWRTLYISHLIIFILGAVVAASAPSLSAVIAGRVIMGLGGSVIQQTNLSYISLYTKPSESASLVACISAMWAIGLVVGGPIGSAFAESQATTWRWAFYVNVPFIGVCVVISLLCIPHHSTMGRGTSIAERMMRLDLAGICLSALATVTFAIACTFCGSIWNWFSLQSILTWVSCGIAFLLCFLQQYFCVCTTANDRALPLHLLSPKFMKFFPLWVATGCAGITYAISLYYVPLYFAFARGHDALQQTVRLLPLVLVFIATVILTGAFLPLLNRYEILFIMSGCITTAGAAAMTVVLARPTATDSQIMGLEALLGVALGLGFQHSLAISNILIHDARDKIDSAMLCNLMQMGGIALMLSVAGCIFQNVGLGLLQDSINFDRRFTDHQVQEALAGVSSALWNESDPRLMARGVQAVAETIAREFYIVLAGGIICLSCGTWMSLERLGALKRS